MNLYKYYKMKMNENQRGIEWTILYLGKKKTVCKKRQ